MKEKQQFKMFIMETSVKSVTTRKDLKRKLLYFSICSRLFILLLSFISNVTLPDHNAGVYMFPLPPRNETVVDRAIEKLFGGLRRWDAQYFQHISHYGYTYENTLAFFPLFPYLTRILARSLELLIGPLINTFSAVLISAVVINFIFFVSAAIKLFELSCLIFQDDRVSYTATLFFCINPASIFFTAPYSESCFSYFTFSGMLFCVKNNNSLLSSFAFGLSGCARSNGVLNIGFIVHKSLKHIVQFLRSETNFDVVFRKVHSELNKVIIYVIVLFAPYVMFQSYLYFIFCSYKTSIPDFLKDYGLLKGFVMPDGTSPPWCDYYIPISYSYIQSHYWNVGFLKYYQLKQIPNFLLAMPVIFVILSNSYLFIVENKKCLKSLGINNKECTYCDRNMKPEFVVYVFHAVILTTFCVLFIHIQVTTRMIASSCPVLYWFVALRYNSASVTVGDPIQSRLRANGNGKNYSLIESSGNINSFWKTMIVTEKPTHLRSSILRLYFISYAIIGTILFSNFYPWT